MLRRGFLGGAGATLAAAGSALAAPGPVKIQIVTRLGNFGLELRPDKAPVTTANFLAYVDRKLMDHATFYRSSRPEGATDFDFGVVQGGLQNDPRYLLKPIAHESTTRTGLKHTNGAISMGRRAPGTATSDFFICVGDQGYLDADPAQKGDNKGFACFGYVTEGLDVVKKIMALPLSANGGIGVMKGEMIRNPLPMKVRRA
ncbi:MAG: peptidylprolyl isomerase [Alphaproteobacteria bacterium PA2]|nr:MAG: peptidylprolyl isomerase [Alphaproteobacteria bacterium PA2]